MTDENEDRSAQPENATEIGTSGVADDLTTGELLNGLSRIDPRRYSEGDVLGRGGMGVILAVEDHTLDRVLAMKLLSPGRGTENPTPEDVGRFLREAKITAHLDHPGIVPVHELGVDVEGAPYFTMKRVQGRDLKAILHEWQRGSAEWSLARLLQILVKVCETVGFAHHRGILHRDLKPANIMVGDFGAVYVMDWGIARALDGSGSEEGRGGLDAAAELRRLVDVDTVHTLPGKIMGSPPYMAPERLAEEGDALALTIDVYSLGAILYQLLTGMVPYAAQRAVGIRDLVDAIQNESPRSVASINADAPVELVAICEMAMARDPAARYQNASALGEDLQNFLEGRVVRAHRTGVLVEVRKWVARNRAMAGAIAAAVLLGVTGIVGFVYQQQRLAQQARDTAQVLREKNEQIQQALDQEREALRRETEARKLAEGLRLVESSKGAVGDDPTLATLLALEAVELAPGREAREALLQAMSSSHELRTMLGHDSYVLAGRVFADGERLVTVGMDPVAILWDLSSGAPIRRFVHPVSTLESVGLVSDEHFVTAAVDGSIRLWSVDHAEPLATVQVASSKPRVLKIEAGRLLVTFEDGAFACAPCSAGRLGPMQVFQSPGSWIRDLRVRPGTETLMAIAASGELLRVDLASGELTFVDDWETEHYSFAQFDTQVDRVLVWSQSKRAAQLREVEGGRVLLEKPATQCRLVDDDGLLLGYDEGDGFGATTRWESYDLEGTPELVAEHVVAGNVQHFSLSPDGRQLAYTDWSKDQHICVYDLVARERVASFNGHTYDVTQLTWLSDGKRIVSLAQDRSVRLWSVDPIWGGRLLTPEQCAEGWEAHTLATPSGPVLHARYGENEHHRKIVSLADGNVLWERTSAVDHGTFAFSPQGATFACVDAVEGEPRRWCLGQLGSPPTEVHFRMEYIYPRFNATGRVLALGARPWPAGDPYPLRIYDSRSGELLQHFLPARDYVGFEVSPDGALLATADRQHRTITIYDLATEEVVHVSDPEHTAWAIDVSFRPDGKLLASTAVDSRVRIWDTDTMELVHETVGLPMAEMDLSWTRDGSLLLVRMPGGVLMIDPDEGVFAMVRLENQRKPQVVAGDSEICLTAYDRRSSFMRIPLDPVAAARAQGLRRLRDVEASRYGLSAERQSAILRDTARGSIAASDHVAWARACLKAGDLDNGLAAFARAHELRPDLDSTTWAFAKALCRRGQPADLEKALAFCVALVERGLLPLEALQTREELAPLHALPATQAAVDRLRGD